MPRLKLTTSPSQLFLTAVFPYRVKIINEAWTTKYSRNEIKFYLTGQLSSLRLCIIHACLFNLLDDLTKGFVEVFHMAFACKEFYKRAVFTMKCETIKSVLSIKLPHIRNDSAALVWTELLGKPFTPHGQMK